MNRWKAAMQRVEPGEDPPPPPAELVELGWTAAYGATLGGLYGSITSVQKNIHRSDTASQRLLPAAGQSTFRWSTRVALFASALCVGKHMCSQAVRGRQAYDVDPVDFAAGGSLAAATTALTLPGNALARARTALVGVILGAVVCYPTGLFMQYADSRRNSCGMQTLPMHHVMPASEAGVTPATARNNEETPDFASMAVEQLQLQINQNPADVSLESSAANAPSSSRRGIWKLVPRWLREKTTDK